MIKGAPRRPEAWTGPTSPALTRTEVPGSMVGIVAALTAEGACLTRDRTTRGCPVAVGQEMQLCVAGMGAARATAAARALHGATAFVSWGVAAGLDPALGAGTVIIAWQVVHPGAIDCEPPDAAQTVAQAWAERLRERLQGRVATALGRLAATDHILGTVANKQTLARTGALGADMESAAIAQVAQSAGIPWIAVRAIVDPANVVLPPNVLLAVDIVGRVRPTRLLASLVQHPRECLQLPALARGFRAALGSLRIVAEVARPALLGPGMADAGDGLQQTAGSEVVP